MKNYTTVGEFCGEVERKKMRGNIRGTGTRKAVAAISLAMLLGMTGCAGKEAAPETTKENISAEDRAQEEPEEGSETDDLVTQKESEKKSANSEEPEVGPADVQGGDSADSTTEESNEPEEESHKLTVSQGTEHLGGKVQNPQADGMTFAQTTLVDEEGMVTLLDVKDAKKIPVKFTEDTRVEHWIIQGGGAGIDMQNAAVSDLQEGMGVELEGHFDGETFVATKVIIEDYV